MRLIGRFLLGLLFLYMAIMAVGYIYASIRQGRLYGFQEFSEMDMELTRSAFLAGFLTVLSLGSLSVRLWPGRGAIQSGISLLTGIPLFGITILCMGGDHVSAWMAVPLLLTGLPILLEILHFFRL
jgi:hypothetical protein